MTSPSRARRRAGAPAPAAKQPDAKPQRVLPPPRPFTPRRGLFVVLMIVFAFWVAGLVAMYVTTVYPHRGRSLPVEEQRAVP